MVKEEEAITLGEDEHGRNRRRNGEPYNHLFLIKKFEIIT